MSKIEESKAKNNNVNTSTGGNSLNGHILSSNSSKTINGSKLKKPTSISKSMKLENYRILQKNLIYVIGLSEKLASKELLNKYEYFGQYGQISKIVVNKNKAYYSESQSKPSYSAYISYQTPQEASLAILAVDSIIADEHLIRASYGTTKYCTFYLKNSECTNKDCLYLHSIADDEVIVNKDELTSNINSASNSSSCKNIFYEQHLLAIKTANIYDSEVKQKLATLSKKKTVLPNLESIYDKDIVIENDPMFLRKVKSSNFKSKNSGTLLKSSKNCELKTGLSLSNVSSTTTTPKAGSSLTTLKLSTKSENNPKSSSEGSSDSNNELNVNKSKSQENIFQKSETSGRNSNSSNTKKNTLNHTPPKKRLYTNRDKSRFPFVVSGENSSQKSNTCNSNIPEYVFDVINKKVSRHSFFKKFENEFEHVKDKIYFEKTLKCRDKNDSWTDFIFTNINLHDD